MTGYLCHCVSYFLASGFIVGPEHRWDHDHLAYSWEIPSSSSQKEGPFRL